MMQNRILAAIFVMSLGGLLALGPAPVIAQSQTGGSAGRPSAQGAAATSAVPIGSDYRVGPGDVIEVSVWKEPEASSQVIVRPDGKISLPLIKDLEVTGKTPMDIEQIVVGKLSPLINSPNVTVTVKEIRSKKVYVLGEVNRTGAYQITQPTTVLQILTEAGGLRPYAKEKSIYILRMEGGRQQKLPFNYKDVVNGKNIQQNIFVQPGDTIIVP